MLPESQGTSHWTQTGERHNFRTALIKQFAPSCSLSLSVTTIPSVLQLQSLHQVLSCSCLLSAILKFPFQSGHLFLSFLQKLQNLFTICLQGCQLLLQITIFCNKWTNFSNETGWQAILAQPGAQRLVVQFTETSLCEQLATFPSTVLSPCSSTNKWLLWTMVVS